MSNEIVNGVQEAWPITTAGEAQQKNRGERTFWANARRMLTDAGKRLTQEAQEEEEDQSGAGGLGEQPSVQQAGLSVQGIPCKANRHLAGVGESQRAHQALTLRHVMRCKLKDLATRLALRVRAETERVADAEHSGSHLAVQRRRRLSGCSGGSRMA